MRFHEMSLVTWWSSVVLNFFCFLDFHGIAICQLDSKPEDRHQPNAEGLGSGTFVEMVRVYEPMILLACFL